MHEIDGGTYLLIWHPSRKYQYRNELSGQTPTQWKTQPHNTQHAHLYQLTPQPLIIPSPGPLELNSQVRQKPPATLDVPSHPNMSEKSAATHQILHTPRLVYSNLPSKNRNLVSFQHAHTHSEWSDIWCFSEKQYFAVSNSFKQTYPIVKQRRTAVSSCGGAF